MRFQRRLAKNVRTRTTGRHHNAARTDSMLEMLERREMLAGDTVSAWHNPLIAGDVNFDQRVSASDLLVVVNDLLRNGSRSLANEEAVPLAATSGSPRPRYIDVNNDNRVSVADVMTVVND